MLVAQRDWIDLVYAFAPAVAALIAVGVGLMQYYLQREQAKWQLYETRFAVYKTLTKNYWDLVRMEHFDINKVGFSAEFYDIGYHCPFLFGSDVTDFLVRLTHAVNDYQTSWLVYRQEMLAFQANKQSAPNMALCPPEKPSTALLTEVMHECSPVFGRYLKLHHDRWWIGRLYDGINRWMDSDIPARLARRHD